MQHKPLSELPIIALTRSDRVLDICLNHLQQSGTVSYKKLDEKFRRALRESLFDMRPHNLRWDDIDKVLSKSFETINGGYNLKALDKVSRKYLGFKGNHIAVNRNDCIEYQALINHIHPAFLIASRFVEHLDNRQISIHTLPSLLENQCPLGFNRNDDSIIFADNHVHFGGVHGAEVLTRLLFDRINRDSFKHLHLPRVPEFTLVNSENYTVTKLISTYRLLFGAFCQLSFEDSSQHKSTLAGLPDQLKTALGASPLRHSSNALYSWAHLRKQAASTEQQIALFEMVKHVGQGNHHQAMIALASALLIQLNQPKLHSKIVSLVLALIHLVNILRGYVVMSGVGLTQFVDFFASDIRRFNKDSGHTQALKWLLNDGNKASLKTSPATDDFNWFADTARDVNKIKGEPDNLNAHFHYCLHFVRDYFAGFKKDMDVQKRHDVRRQAQQLERLLKSQIRHHFVDNKTRLLKGEQEKKTFWVPSLVRGFDVAGNENHFPIHIFAPALRYLRDKPLTVKQIDGTEQLSEQRYLSIHAGEDYSHLISGLRHIDETVRYCDMRHGDRIGHGLALGVDPELWAERQQQAFVNIEEDLWNTVWLHHYAVELSEKHHEALLMIAPLERRLEKIKKQLFGVEEINNEQLWAYWRNRGNSQQHEKWMRNSQCFNDKQYWVQFDIPKAMEQPFAKITMLLKNAKKEKQKTITITLNAKSELHQLPPSQPEQLSRQLNQPELVFYRLLQDHLMMAYDYKGITLEVCPSSNISLGRFEDYHEHPVFRWFPPDEAMFEQYQWDSFGIRRKGEISVCINTDDPGIFPTKIEQEYHLLKNAAKQHYGLSSQTAENWIERLRKLSLQAFNA